MNGSDFFDIPASTTGILGACFITFTQLFFKLASLEKKIDRYFEGKRKTTQGKQ